MDKAGRKLQYKENFDCLILNNPDECNWTFPFDESRRKKNYNMEVLFLRSADEFFDSLPTFIGNPDDRLRWIAYPKKSGSIPSDLSRDFIWENLGPFSFQPVAMVSLDENWSAMRIRHSRFVKQKVVEKTAMPAELKALLTRNPACEDYFKTLSNTNQKEYIQWISSAKRADTRQRRLERTKTLLEDKVPNPYTSR